MKSSEAMKTITIDEALHRLRGVRIAVALAQDAVRRSTWARMQVSAQVAESKLLRGEIRELGRRACANEGKTKSPT